MTVEVESEEIDPPFEQLSPEDQKRAKVAIAEHCHEMLDSRRDAFIVGPRTFAAAVWRQPENIEDKTIRETFDRHAGRAIPASAIRRVLDWAENDWPMSLGDFLSGMFFGKEWDKKTPPWRLIPAPEDRMSAESLGFGHLYPKKED